MENHKDEKLTEELLQELLNRPLSCFVKNADQAGNFTAKNLPNQLDTLLQEKNLQKKDIVKATDINETHLYQIFSGDRGASRDKIIQIALALKLNLKQTNQLLNSAGVSELYCKNRRDAIIIFSVEHSYSVSDANQTLYDFKETTLSDN